MMGPGVQIRIVEKLFWEATAGLLNSLSCLRAILGEFFEWFRMISNVAG